MHEPYYTNATKNTTVYTTRIRKQRTKQLLQTYLKIIRLYEKNEILGIHVVLIRPAYMGERPNKSNHFDSVIPNELMFNSVS